MGMVMVVFRRLARDLDFPLAAGAADLNPRQWAGIVAYLR
jgi:hypothetical protein